MWTRIAGVILRNRVTILVILGVITVFMAFKAQKVEMSYQYAPLLPQSDSTYIEYEKFKELFGNEGNMIMMGVQSWQFFDFDHYKIWQLLKNDLDTIAGVQSVFSVFDAFSLRRNPAERRFELNPVFEDVNSQYELDSLRNVLYSLPVYDRQLYNRETNACMMTVTLSPSILESPARVQLVEAIKAAGSRYEAASGNELHYSGLPFIRVETAQMLQSELVMFVVLALVVCAVIIYLFFRSFKVVMFLLLIVAVSVVWALGIIGVSGFKVTMLTGMIPPLIIVIGIPNSVFMLNKYHQEIRKHGNKIRSLQRVIRKMGNVTFLTNLTTAIGFATFIFTNSRLLVEFGIITAINIVFIFVLTILLIPIIFSFIAVPREKYVKHLESRLMRKIINRLVFVSMYHRKLVFAAAFVMLAAGGYGISRIHTTGFMLDDVPHNNRLYSDLKFFEHHFSGLMPLEILVDTRKSNGIMQAANMQNIDRLQGALAAMPELSKAISYTEAVKFARQAYYNGNPDYFSIPGRQELSFILSYLQSGETGEAATAMMHTFVDSTRQRARISLRMADVGTTRMKALNDSIATVIQAHFPESGSRTSVTGSSVIFFKGTSYLIRNLLVSLAFAILLIATLMSAMFRSWRMALVSLVPNLIPLIMTAALMGYFGIPIKPSTVLVFSVAFGISVDDTIHYLAKYRQELGETNWSIRAAVVLALKETGVSMIYTSIILLCGFGIFCLSQFGGTAALGMLVALTLLIAMFSNLILLPSLLLAMMKRITNRSFKESLLPIFDEKDDADNEGVSNNEYFIDSERR
ncbi:MAG: MMPL family transporter [Cytophagaceae bacterium]|jgi:predicted RND superfamily exporter protein|nr:MMPL family transporter [Cytophagaceae bacterium]